MKRRHFLQAAGLLGLSVTVPTFSRSVGAQSQAYGGPYFVLVTATGGWDPRMMFDPILGNSEQNNYYGNIGSVGPFNYADYPIDLDAFNLDTTLGYESYLMTPGQFLQKYAGQLALLNGVDTTTNNHDAGRRSMACGSIPGEFPALGALLAHAKAPDKPIGFISSGGYDRTAGLVPLARVENASALRKVAFPNQIDPSDPMSDVYHLPQTYQRIADAQRERLETMRGRQHLPKLTLSKDSLHLARTNDFELAQLQIPTNLIDIEGGGMNDLERMLNQAQLAMSAFKSGLAVAASLTIGGFDTHGNHNRDQPRQCTKLLYGIDFVMEEAKRQGLDGNVVVIATSDFGRGPLYNGSNDNAGKDHWPVTSMFAMGPGIAGNRVVGGTTDEQRARALNPETLEFDDNGVKISAGSIHRALRRAAGIADSAGAQSWPLPGEDMPLFG